MGPRDGPTVLRSCFVQNIKSRDAEETKVLPQCSSSTNQRGWALFQCGKTIYSESTLDDSPPPLPNQTPFVAGNQIINLPSRAQPAVYVHMCAGDIQIQNVKEGNKIKEEPLICVSAFSFFLLYGDTQDDDGPLEYYTSRSASKIVINTNAWRFLAGLGFVLVVFNEQSRAAKAVFDHLELLGV